MWLWVSYKKKIWKTFFFRILKVTEERSRIRSRDPLVRGADPDSDSHQNVTDPLLNTGFFFCKLTKLEMEKLRNKKIAWHRETFVKLMPLSRSVAAGVGGRGGVLLPRPAGPAGRHPRPQPGHGAACCPSPSTHSTCPPAGMLPPPPPAILSALD
jgi:hypothetical protein